jgi:hypothetical protein
VAITENNAAATAPSSVTVPVGARTASFTITTSVVTATRVGTVRATYGSVTRSATLTVQPIGIATLALAPNPVKGGNPVTGTVTLDAPATGSGIVVRLSSSRTSVARPAVGSITIPAGSRTGTFTINTSPVGALTSAGITATANGRSKSVTLFVRT